MSAPPRARSEYSRGTGASEGVSEAHDSRLSHGSGGVTPPPWGSVGGWLFGAALLGAVLLLVAEFTTLYTERIASFHAPATAVATGPHDSYAMVPIAILAVILAAAVLRAGSRPALLAVGIAGLVALLIALLGDLPDSHASGLIIGPSGQFVSAVSDPGAGMYLETLGAVVLIAVSGLGFILIGRPAGGGPGGTPPRHPRLPRRPATPPAPAAPMGPTGAPVNPPPPPTPSAPLNPPSPPAPSAPLSAPPPPPPSDTPENRS